MVAHSLQVLRLEEIMKHESAIHINAITSLKTSWVMTSNIKKNKTKKTDKEDKDVCKRKRDSLTWLLWMEMAHASFNGSCCRLRYTPPAALNVQRSRFITSTAPHRKRTLGRPDGERDMEVIRSSSYRISPRTASNKSSNRTIHLQEYPNVLYKNSPSISSGVVKLSGNKQMCWSFCSKSW